MRTTLTLSYLAATISLSSAWSPPIYPNRTIIFNESFHGVPGSLPDQTIWNITTGFLRFNSEEETYTNSTRNINHSKNNTLQIIPTIDSNRWMSGRIESKQTIKPLPGHITMAEAVIRFGNDSTFHKQGVWPAFWLLGSSNREPGGKKWPMCGEIDIMETKNGEAIAYNTVHCDQPTGGLCAEPKGITQSINMTTSQSWHTWRVEWDLTSTEMETQSITWYRDGESSFSLTGWDIPSEEVWRSLTQNSLYFILNVAIGGTFPGYSNSSTLGGNGSMMEVGYVAAYISN